MSTPKAPSQEFCEVLRFADRVRVANKLSDREFREAMRYAEAIEMHLAPTVGRVESAALCVAVFRCGRRAMERKASSRN